MSEGSRSAGDVPIEALNIRYNNSGFVPHVALHHRRGLIYQESSYSHFWQAGILVFAAAIITCLPWEKEAGPGGKLRYWIAGGLVWGAICSFVPYFIRNTFGQTIIVDPKSKKVSINSSDFRGEVGWDRLIGLQVCRQKDLKDSEMNGFQLNLVWVGDLGKVNRHCLLKHSIKGMVLRLGRQYESFTGLKLIDHTP